MRVAPWKLLIESLESRTLLSVGASIAVADVNGDGAVNSTDATVIFQNFNKPSNGTPASGDLNFDGVVNAIDFNALASLYGQQIAFSAPIIITTGGTYSGAWKSNDPNTPAIRVRTTQPVIIENSVIHSRGKLIRYDIDHTKITVRNTRGYAQNPNVAGMEPGRFFDVQNFDHAILENNYMQGTSGMVVRNFIGNKSAANTIRVTNNVALNIDGRLSDGAGGYRNFNRRTSKSDGHSEEGFYRVQFFQMGVSTNVANVEIAWNQVINEAGNSRVEDNISIFRSSGTAASPINIHDNYVHGAYTIQPAQKHTSDANWTYDWGYSGGGIMLGDGGATTISEACGFVNAYNNQVIDTTNFGISVTAGHDTQMYNNRIISAGVTASGQTIAAQNVGATVWDQHGNRNLTPPTWFNCGGQGNLIGWNLGTGRNDWWIPNATSWTNNTHWPGTITLATQAGEYGVWRAKLTAGNVKIGPL